jgi:hypothetical protein
MQKRIETGRSVTGDVFRVKGNIKPVEDYQDEIPF